VSGFVWRLGDGTLVRMSSTTLRPRPGSRAPRRSPRIATRRLARARKLRRRRRAVLLLFVVTTVLIVAADMLRGGTEDPPGADTLSGHPHAAGQLPGAKRTAPPTMGAGGGDWAAGRSPAPPAAAVSYPRDGSQRFTTAPGHSRVYGTGGTLLRFQVAVEADIRNLDVPGFADQVATILGDPQGWTAGGQWRFQRVGPASPHDFTLYLVTPGTRDKMCHDVPDGYTSCRYEDDVMINVSRWEHGVPFYPSLHEYREYAISHEVGHRLGEVHELCPGKGKLAPTMQQQTLGLHGCKANPWPYPDGRLYAGVRGDYDQSHIPTDPPSYFTTG
jgi:Protein of unknown function (DUF3152)